MVDDYFGSLSNADKRKVCIVVALLAAMDVLVLEEPTRDLTLEDSNKVSETEELRGMMCASTALRAVYVLDHSKLSLGDVCTPISSCRSINAVLDSRVVVRDFPAEISMPERIFFNLRCLKFSNQAGDSTPS